MKEVHWLFRLQPLVKFYPRAAPYIISPTRFDQAITKPGKISRMLPGTFIGAVVTKSIRRFCTKMGSVCMREQQNMVNVIVGKSEDVVEGTPKEVQVSSNPPISVILTKRNGVISAVGSKCTHVSLMNVLAVISLTRFMLFYFDCSMEPLWSKEATVLKKEFWDALGTVRTIFFWSWLIVKIIIFILISKIRGLLQCNKWRYRRLSRFRFITKIWSGRRCKWKFASQGLLWQGKHF